MTPVRDRLSGRGGAFQHKRRIYSEMLASKVVGLGGKVQFDCDAVGIFQEKLRQVHVGYQPLAEGVAGGVEAGLHALQILCDEGDVVDAAGLVGFP